MEMMADESGGDLDGGVYSPDRGALPLFTDLYQLRMLQAYFEEEMMEEAVFSLFVRRLPPRRNLLIACGLDTVARCLERIRFTQSDLSYLDSLGEFSGRFLDWLGGFRFTGDVRAVREGTPVFAQEPIMEVSAPLPQAQLIETFVLNQIQLQTMLASKAYRLVAAAAGRPVVDFGARRIHGIDAAVHAARAFYVAGVSATSNVLGGQLHGVPLAGTMAHSYIQSHEDELAAFREFSRLYPETVLLVDTYDPIGGVKNVIRLAESLGGDFAVRAVRLDSGKLLDLSMRAREALDAAGLHQVEIFASGGLDEDAISDLVSAGAPIDGFGVGTGMGVSSDAPYLDIVYKMTVYAGRGRVKLAASKEVLPGPKQVFRASDSAFDTGDIIARADEDLPGRPLLSDVMRGGKRLPHTVVDLDAVRRYAAGQFARLPASTRSIAACDRPYPVEASAALLDYHREVSMRTAS